MITGEIVKLCLEKPSAKKILLGDSEFQKYKVECAE